jgi:hypothetical protein
MGAKNIFTWLSNFFKKINSKALNSRLNTLSIIGAIIFGYFGWYKTYLEPKLEKSDINFTWCDDDYIRLCTEHQSLAIKKQLECENNSNAGGFIKSPHAYIFKQGDPNFYIYFGNCYHNASENRFRSMALGGKNIFGEQVYYKTKLNPLILKQYNEICNDLRLCDSCMNDSINPFLSKKKRSAITKYADICRISSDRKFLPPPLDIQNKIYRYFTDNFFKPLAVGDYYFLEVIYTENQYLYNPFRFRLTTTDSINLYQPSTKCFINGFGFLNSITDYPMVYIQITNDLSKIERSEIDHTLQIAQESIAHELSLTK